jgi:outer membrane lipoprotein-sorting protein
MISLLFGFLFLVAPQKKSSASADDIMKRVEQNSEGVLDFVVSLEGEIDMERLRVPRTTATMYYKKPDKVTFDSPGFGLVPREGVFLNAMVLRQRYNSTLAGDDTAWGKRALKLQLAAKDAKTRLRELQLWVDPDNWTIVRAQATPYEGRILTLDFTYAQHVGTYWLPRRMKAIFGTTSQESVRPRLDSNPSPVGQLEETQRAMPRSGSITINYLNYRINTNLPDSLFQPKDIK